jgi:hypothetical protein
MQRHVEEELLQSLPQEILEWVIGFLTPGSHDMFALACCSKALNGKMVRIIPVFFNALLPQEAKRYVHKYVERLMIVKLPHLNTSQISVIHLKQLISRMTWIKSLTLGRFDVCELSSFASKMPQLETLKLKIDGTDGLGQLEKLTNLTTLKVEAARIWGSKALIHTNTLSKMTKLTTLSIKSDVLRASQISKLTNLTCLDIAKCSKFYRDRDSFWQNIPYQGLKTLRISLSELSPLKNIPNECQLTNLTSLTIRVHHCVILLSDLFANMVNLKEVRFTGNWRPRAEYELALLQFRGPSVTVSMKGFDIGPFISRRMIQ